MIAKTTLQKANSLIQSTQYPLLVCHVAPDGDALGSLLGLSKALTQLGKQPLLACADPVPAHYRFLAGAELIDQEVTAPFDLVITLDCSDLQRVGHIAETPGFSDCSLLNIDPDLALLASLIDRGAALIITFGVGLLSVPYLSKRTAVGSPE